MPISFTGNGDNIRVSGVGPTGPMGPQGATGATGAAATFSGTSSQLTAGDGSAVTVGANLTLSGGTLAATATGSSGGAAVGTFANRPAAGTSGRIYIATDSPIAQWVDDGSAWRPLIQGQALGTQVPPASAFTAFNAGSGFSFNDNNGVISFGCTAATSVDNYRCAAISLSSSTAYVQAAVEDTTASSNSVGASVIGIALRESSSNKGLGVMWFNWSANTSNDPRANSIIVAHIDANGRMSLQTARKSQDAGATFARIYRSGSNVVVAMSRDGLNWKTSYTVATSTVFSSAPDQVSFGVMDYNVSSGNLLSFKYGSL